MGGPLKLYDVVTPSGVRTRMQLNETDAERYNATLAQPEVKARLDVQDKMRTPARRGRKPLPRDEDGNIIRDKADR